MRRVVRLDAAFRSALDRQLGEQRGTAGQPSSADVLAYELPAIIELFATTFDDMWPLYEGREDYRYTVTSGGLLFDAAIVIGQLMPEGTVVLLDIEIEL